MKPDYGVDAPGVVLGLGVAGVGSLFGAVLAGSSSGLFYALLFPGVSMAATAGVMLYGSRIGKLRLRERLVDSLKLKGDERVLDVGCGRGLLLLAVAKRLRTGRSVGIDLWRKADQSGNDREVTLRNARAEKVEERVELHTGDMRELPFADETFDAVVSSWAIHNIPTAEGREQALREAVRVLRPGGKMLIVDIGAARSYSGLLQAAGMREVSVTGPSFLFVTPSWRISATKPI